MNTHPRTDHKPPAKARQRGPVEEWLDELASSDVPAAYRAVLARLATYMDWQTLADARPGHARLARETGFGLTVVGRALNYGVATRRLEQTRKGSNLKGGNLAATYSGLLLDRYEMPTRIGTSDRRVGPQVPMGGSSGTDYPVIDPVNDLGTASPVTSADAPAPAAPQDKVKGGADGWTIDLEHWWPYVDAMFERNLEYDLAHPDQNRCQPDDLFLEETGLDVALAVEVIEAVARELKAEADLDALDSEVPPAPAGADQRVSERSSAPSPSMSDRKHEVTS